MKKSIFILAVCLTATFSLIASDESQIFATGNKAYQEKNYTEAIKNYESLIRGGWDSPDLEYNLGNAWYKNGSAGRAILHYERALLLAPNHREAQQNIEFLKSKMTNPIQPLPPFFLAKWWVRMRSLLPPTGMSILGMLLWWTGIGAFAAWVLGKSRRQKKWGFIAGICLAAMSCLLFGLAISRANFEKNSELAILIQKSAILRAAPAEASDEILSLEEGTKLELVEFSEGWWQVKLEDGEVGWLPAGTIEQI